MRPKWGEKHGAETYGERTIRGVLGVVKEQYGSPRASSRRGREGPAGGPSRDNGARPKIVITDTRLRDISDQSLDHLVATNEPERLFVRARGLVRIGTDEKGIAVIDRLNEHSFRGILERTCDYVRLQPDKKGNDKILWKEVPTAPSKDLVNDVLSLGAWPFPVVESVVQTPIIHLDGSIITAAGYDPKTLSYYAPPNGTTIPAVPDVPTDQDVKDAADLIWEPFIDFPFIDETSKTHIAAALLTIVLRPVIPGPVPAFIIDKPAPGTGASLIASILSVIGQGGDAAVIGAPRDDDAWSKKITATLRAGITLANVDNVEHKLFAPSLAAVLTATIWRDRILGLSEMITLPNRTVWVLNGNNVSLGGDLPRRVIWSRMDAVSERPWQRERVKPYKHPDVLVWTYENRGRILAAVLTLTRNWIHKGRPGPGDVPKLGGYEPWRDIIGGILAASGFPGFLGNLEDVYSEMDVDGSQWDAFISRWYEIWGEDPITAADIINRIKRETDSTDPQSAGSLRMLDALPDDIADAINDRKGSPSKRVGNAIRKRKDRVFSGGLRLVKAGTKQRAITWRIKPVEKQSVLQTHQTPPQDTEKVSLQKNASVDEVSLVSLYLTDRGEEKKDNLSHIGNGGGQTHQTHPHDVNTQNTNSLFPENRVEENFHHLIGKYDLHPDLDVSGHTRFKKAGSQCSCKGCGSPGEWHDYENKIRPAPLCDRHYRELKAACERDLP
ncbi:hypothetical protein ASZ90_015821 [hydrocarbon metagenome]|uniref:Uncharacterized protein n=1 Tax=hydrocarbon metagenome TaxID=938273 RepID=A0A0W8F0X3_9ZZZZ